MPENTIKVCRPGMWGNPFKPRCNGHVQPIVDAYEAWLGSADWDSWLWFKHRKHWLRTQDAPDRLKELLADLHGKNLACWCAQGAACHADILLKLANEEPTP